MLMTSKTFTAVGVSGNLTAEEDGPLNLDFSCPAGTFVAKVVVERAVRPSRLSWEVVSQVLSSTANISLTARAGDVFRVRCISYASGSPFALLSVPSHTDRAPAPLLPATMHRSDIIPRVHMKRFSSKSSPVVVIVGDSVSTATHILNPYTPIISWGGANAVFDSEAPSVRIMAEIERQNPDKTIQFYDFGVGGTGWTNLDSAPIPGSPFPPWYTVTTNPWLGYIQAVNPDLILFCFGGNDAGGINPLSIKSVFTKIMAWATSSPTPPDLIIQTNWHSNSLAVDTSGQRVAMGLQRTLALSNAASFGIAGLPNIGLVDLGRMACKMIDGVDPANQALRRHPDWNNRYMPAGGNALLPQTAGDFAITAYWPAVAGVPKLPSFYINNVTHGSIYMQVAPVSTTGASAFCNAGNNSVVTPTLATDGSMPTLSGDRTISLSFKNGVAAVACNGQNFGRWRVPYQCAPDMLNFITTGGNRLLPYYLTYYVGEEAKCQPTVDAATMVGLVNGPIGGNGGGGDNHPSSYATQRLWQTVYGGTDWAASA